MLELTALFTALLLGEPDWAFRLPSYDDILPMASHDPSSTQSL